MGPRWNTHNPHLHTDTPHLPHINHTSTTQHLKEPPFPFSPPPHARHPCSLPGRPTHTDSVQVDASMWCLATIRRPQKLCRPNAPFDAVQNRNELLRAWSGLRAAGTAAGGGCALQRLISRAQGSQCRAQGVALMLPSRHGVGPPLLPLPHPTRFNDVAIKAVLHVR